MNFVNQVVEKAKANKTLLTKVGGTLVGAAVGFFVSTAVTAEPDDIFLEQMLEDVEDAVAEE